MVARRCEVEQVVKLTVRLPGRLHDRLKRRARQSHRSLNALIVESLWLGAVSAEPESEADVVRAVLVRSGLWAPLGPEWSDLTRGAEDLGDEELREQLEGVPPLSEVIIEDRGPR